MICDALVADWEKIAGFVTSIGTIGALVFAGLTMRQTSTYRREDQRDRLLGTLLDQLATLRRQQQRVEWLQRDLRRSHWDDQDHAETERDLAEQIARHLDGEAADILTLHSAIAAADTTTTAQLREWRTAIDEIGTHSPQLELQIDELAAQVKQDDR